MVPLAISGCAGGWGGGVFWGQKRGVSSGEETRVLSSRHGVKWWEMYFSLYSYGRNMLGRKVASGWPLNMHVNEVPRLQLINVMQTYSPIFHLFDFSCKHIAASLSLKIYCS